MASLEADKTGASAVPGKNHYSRVRVDGANVLTNCIKKNKKPKKHPRNLPTYV